MASAPGAARIDWTLHLRKAGPIRIGMTLPEVRQALGDSRAKFEDDGVTDGKCGYIASSVIPTGLSVMLVEGHVVRIDVYESGFRAASGAKIGYSESRISKLYRKDLTIEPHHYLAEIGHYMTYAPKSGPDRGYGVRFETDGQTVSRFYAGTAEAINWVEGCL